MLRRTIRAGDEDVCVICFKRAVGGAGLSREGSVGGEVGDVMLGGQASLEPEELCSSSILIPIRI